MKQSTDWMPAVRHNRSQNAGVVYALLDVVIVVVGALMKNSPLELKVNEPSGGGG